VSAAARLGGWRAPLGVAALVLLAYLPSLGNGFVYDDHEVVLQQAPVDSLGELARVFAEPHGLPQSQLPYYRPITRATLLAQKGFHGDAPALFHLANALVMSAVGVVAWTLVRNPAFGLGAPAAAWAAAAFALHPVASECVHPIASGRESSLPALFMLATVSAWLAGRRALALGCFAAALWSKEQAVVVPLLVAWAEALGLAPDPSGRRLSVWARRMAPFAAVGAAYGVARSLALAARADEGMAPLLAHWSAHPLGPLEALLHQLQVSLAPRAALVYEPAFADWFSPARSTLALLAFGLALGALFALRPIERPAPSRAAIWFWIGWMPIAMAVNANWLPLEAPFAERYVFVSLLGAAALVAAAARRGAAHVRLECALPPLAVAALAALAALSIHRAGFYRDELAFTRQWVATSPRHGNAHASLGAALARAGRDEEAVAALRQAVRLEPRLASAHYNLGATLARAGRRDEAIAAFRDALRTWSSDPDAHYALGVLLAQRGEHAEAVAHLREAARLRPGWSEAEAALGRLSR
jgi:tetratricopeptide (TPR) repeat protein